MNKEYLEAIKKVERAKGAMQGVIDTIKTLLEEEKPSGVWQPKHDDNIYVIDDCGEVNDCTWYDDSEQRKAQFEYGNVFQTKEQAEQHLERLKITQKLKELAGGYEFEYGDYDNFCIAKNPKGSIEVDCHAWQMLGTIYFPTKEAAQNAIDVLGDKLKVLF